MKTRNWLYLSGILVIIVLGAVQLFTGDTLIRQERNMKLAREHVPIVRQKLDATQGFRHLLVTEYSAAGGSLLIDGFVPSEADVKRVREIVEQTLPPVTVVYQIIATNDFK